MFDRMKFKGLLEDFAREAPSIIRRYHLEECSRGGEVYYQTSPLGRIGGVFVMIRGVRVEVSCSVHKLTSRRLGGRLDNSRGCSVSEARETLRLLFADLGIDTTAVRVPYYEIGVSMQMGREPLDYIRAVRGVGEAREMFIDANYERDRQKTTEKSRNYRKVMKIYDKTFEAEDRGRTGTDRNVLRVETVYRRQGAWLSDFYDPVFTDRLADRFYRDWSALLFERRLAAAKGVHGSQLEKARLMTSCGPDGYLRTISEWRNSGVLTPKQYRSWREFGRDWDGLLSHLFSEQKGELEEEYQRELLAHFLRERL